jgi:hypothetical protein
MIPNITAIERAFALAKSGKYLYIAEIRERLRFEGYFTETITGPHLSNQLRAAIRSARMLEHKPLPRGTKPQDTIWNGQ